MPKHRKNELSSLHGDNAITEREVGMRRMKGQGETILWRIWTGIDGQAILKAVVAAALLIFFALLQTTIFARFRPFGVVPDLMLPLVIAVAMTEREKWGAIFGIIAAFVIESLGGAPIFILALLYMPTGYLCGILTVQTFRDSLAVRAMYTAIACAVHSFFTLFLLMSTVGGIDFASAMGNAVIPEFFASLLFAPLPHIAAKATLRVFHRTRDEKVL